MFISYKTKNSLGFTLIKLQLVTSVHGGGGAKILRLVCMQPMLDLEPSSSILPTSSTGKIKTRGDLQRCTIEIKLLLYNTKLKYFKCNINLYIIY